MPVKKKTHDEVARFYDQEYHKPGHPSPALNSFQALRKRIKPGKDDYILDVACGKGAWLREAGTYSTNTFGIDISYSAIKSCRDYNPGGYFCTGLGEKLPFKSNTFDIVTCLGSLEHFLDQKLGLSEIKRVAKKTARIVILVPNSGFLTYQLGIYRGTNQAGIKETIQSIEEWKNLFTLAGFSIIDSWPDYHILSWDWISMRGRLLIPVRAIQALLLLVWPLKWQYQVYFLCEIQ